MTDWATEQDVWVSRRNDDSWPSSSDISAVRLRLMPDGSVRWIEARTWDGGEVHPQ